NIDPTSGIRARIRKFMRKTGRSIDEDLLQIDEDAMEEIDIRWQVAMITA
ncbi:hypothetical protein Tco_0579897, partial [Tanacetum coccineum]